jgi:hypothetical protein
MQFINLLLISQIKTYTKDGINKICLTGCDPRIFCIGVRIVKRRTVQQVALILLEYNFTSGLFVSDEGVRLYYMFIYIQLPVGVTA